MMEDSFSISTTGLLGLDWDLAMKAKIDRAKNIYIITNDKNAKYLLRPGLHPIAHIPPRQNGYKVRCTSKHPDGSYFVDGPFVIPGLYNSQTSEWQLLTFNEDDAHVFLHREDLIVKPRNEFCTAADDYENIIRSHLFQKKKETQTDSVFHATKCISHANSLLRKVLDNTRSLFERQVDLSYFYRNQLSDTMKIYNARHDPVRDIRHNLFLSKFSTQLENVEKEIDAKTANEVKDLLYQFSDVFVLPGDPLPAVTDVEHRIKLTRNREENRGIL